MRLVRSRKLPIGLEMPPINLCSAHLAARGVSAESSHSLWLVQFEGALTWVHFFACSTRTSCASLRRASPAFTISAFSLV